MKMFRKLLAKKQSNQAVLVQSLEGIGDILVFETRRQKNKLVLDGLQKIRASVERLFDVQQDDPDRFEALVLSQEFLQLYRADEKEAQFRLAFEPEKYLISFSAAINQIVRVYESAIDSQNTEISRFSVYHINWILGALASREKNAIFVEQLLRKLAGITRVAVGREDRSAYAAAIHWYTSIVFERPGEERTFVLSYLELFDKYFFSTVRYIVSENKFAIFESLVSTLVDGIHVQDYHRGEIWNYGHLIMRENFQRYIQLNSEHEIERRVKELADSENDIDTQEKLSAWLKKFDELKEIIEPHLAKTQEKAARELETNIKNFATLHFKHQNLLEVVFAIGAFCLFKERYRYIRHLWEYKQPPDADASWLGHDITPRTLNEIIGFYFRKGLFEQKLDFWEGHHGSEQYHKQYFLLLLTRVLQGVPKGPEGRYSEIENYKLPDLNVYRLSDLEYSIDGFIELARNLKEAKGAIGELGFDTANLDELFEIKLVLFLEKLRKEARKQISAKHKTGDISEKKIQEFKNEVVKSFSKGAHMREIFRDYLSAYEDRTDERVTDTKERFGITIADDKAAFFDEWHVHYVGWGENYGRDLAGGESSQLFDELAKGCRQISKEQFEFTLSTYKDIGDIVIFTTRVGTWRFFQESPNFRPKWHRDVEQIQIGSFEGWYDYEGQSIPVFETFHRKIDNQTLILNKQAIGQLVQLSPLNEGEDAEAVEGIFYIDVRAFSDDPEMMNALIEKAPEWLKKVGDESRQRDHLQERVRIQVLERFEYRRPDDFEGYKFSIEED